jgi:glycosyltransferase involved in cell wall biosynthesis
MQGYPCTVLRNYPLRQEKHFRFFSFMNPGVLAKVLRGKFDGVLLGTWSYASDWLVMAAAMITRTPIFFRVESPYGQEILKSSWKLLIKKLVLGYFLFPRITRFLYTGIEAKKFCELYRVPQAKLIFAPYSVDNDRLFALASDPDTRTRCAVLRSELHINQDTFVILFVGKLTDKKRPLDLLRAYESLANDRAALVFVGDGPLRPTLEAYVSGKKIPRVYFAGFQSQERLPAYYMLGDVFVLPSGLGETWGLVVNEAMCFGLPIIVSDMVGCGPDLVEHGKNGYVIALGDTAGLAARLHSLVADRTLKEEFGRASRLRIRTYSHDAVAIGIISALTAGKSYPSRHTENPV